MKEENMSIEELTIDHIIKWPNEVYIPKPQTEIQETLNAIFEDKLEVGENLTPSILN